jgi:AbrB family looped-hinge helix DNA binding protein
MNDRKLVRVQVKGQVTIPAAIRKKLGLKRGDLVAVVETTDGVFITPQQVLATKALESIGDILKGQGLSLKKLIVSGRQVRSDLLQETSGITQTPKQRRFSQLICTFMVYYRKNETVYDTLTAKSHPQSVDRAYF